MFSAKVYCFEHTDVCNKAANTMQALLINLYINGHLHNNSVTTRT